MLPNKGSASITFAWNISGFIKGNYTAKAVADTVLNETDTSDNIYIDGWIMVLIVGEVTGPDGWPDGKVDIRDIAAIALLFGVDYPDP